MSYAPATLNDLRTYWQSQNGTYLGIVGDTRHTKGYHLGRDRIYDGTGPGLGDADYSVKTARDKRGLTDGAAAFDFGKLDGSFTKLQAFSVWLVEERCRRNAPGTSDIREVIYSPDGDTVLRWDRQRGYASAPRPGEADNSHRWHTHISYYRDSEQRDKVSLIRGYFEQEGDDVPTLTEYLPGYTATLKGTSNVRRDPVISSATLLRTVPASQTEDWAITGWLKGDVDDESGSDLWVCRWSAGRWEYTAKINLINPPQPPADMDCTDEVFAAYGEGEAAGYARAEAECAQKVADAQQQAYQTGLIDGVEATKAKARVAVVYDE